MKLRIRMMRLAEAANGQPVLLWMGDATRVSRDCGSGAALVGTRLEREVKKRESMTTSTG